MPTVLYYTPFRVATFVLVLAIGLTLVQVPIRSAQNFPREGQLADETVVAVDDLTFDSGILTAEARDEASADVPIRLAFDAGVRTAQVAALSNYFDEVDGVRDDALLSEAEQTEAFASIPDQNASARSQFQILDFTDGQWSRVKARAIELLTDVLTENVSDV